MAVFALDCSRVDWQPGQLVQVLEESDLHTAMADAQIASTGRQTSVQEVSSWSGYIGLVVAVHDDNRTVRVDFSQKAGEMKSLCDSLQQQEQERERELEAAREAADDCSQKLGEMTRLCDSSSRSAPLPPQGIARLLPMEGVPL